MLRKPKGISQHLLKYTDISAVFNFHTTIFRSCLGFFTSFFYALLSSFYVKSFHKKSKTVFLALGLKDNLYAKKALPEDSFCNSMLYIMQT